MRRSLLLFCALPAFCGAGASVHAAPGETLAQRLPPSEVRAPDDHIVTLAVENDNLGGGSDRHYTSGVRLTYYDLNASFPAPIWRLAEILPGFGIGPASCLVYSVGQNLYTPEDIKSRRADPDDRPWAAYLYASYGMATLTDNHVDEVEATLGLVGPGALGEQAQKNVHKLIGSPDPKGWDNQLETEPGLTLSWQRRWPEAAQASLAGMALSIDPYAGAAVGNIYTYGDMGLAFRFGPRRDRWDDAPLRVRPAMPGTGYFSAREKGWGWHVFGGVEGRAVARNIFLDGNTFRDGPSVDKKPFVADLNLGVAATAGRVRLSYTVVYRTKEFDGQKDPDVFGAVSLGYRF